MVLLLEKRLLYERRDSQGLSYGIPARPNMRGGCGPILIPFLTISALLPKTDSAGMIIHPIRVALQSVSAFDLGICKPARFDPSGFGLPNPAVLWAIGLMNHLLRTENEAKSQYRI